ncbi:hypothetical protein CSUI_001415 [Cystoisospora suis]|uniref:Uncharacterized protein n=1 Tax=Cystoisospora suis TaxID=483139 RepID=A0A2C6LD02_9APIC|nr:hypothetical protein CSUI_001415 [Cystoisospora suis]
MAWMLKGEYDFLVASLSERLDLAKCRGFLHCSLDLRLMNASDPSFLHYVGLGKDYLGTYVTRRLRKTGLGLQSKYMHRSFAASVVDDCNLAHVTQVLRIEELLESNFQDLPVSVSSLVLLAIIGELEAVLADLQRVEEDSTELAEFKTRSVKFVSKTLGQLVDFIVESGRDRFTYIKESLILPTATPPRPGPVGDTTAPRDVKRIAADLKLGKDPFLLARRFANDDTGSGDVDLGTDYLTSLYALYKRGDPQLEVLLHSGSILSLWRRLHALFGLPQQTARELVRWSIIRQAPRMNKLRQLVFTRLVQILCNPSLRGASKAAELKDLQNLQARRDAAIAYTVLSAFSKSGVKIWCYESEAQKLDIVRSGMPPDIVEKVMAIICLKVDRGFLDLPLGEELPDAETLEQWFAPQWGRTLGGQPLEYHKLSVTDSNLYRMIPQPYASATQLLRHHVSSDPGMVPDFALGGDSRFFSAPLTTAFINVDKFEETINAFMTMDEVDV